MDAGLRPVLKGNRLVLGKLVLVRADGEETKYADEVRNAGVEVNFWGRAPRGGATESTARTLPATGICCPT